MALFIIMGIVFIFVSIFFGRPAKNQATQNLVTKTIVNIKLQDELFCYYFKRITADTRKAVLAKYSPDTSPRPLAFYFYIHLSLYYLKYGLQEPYNHQERINKQLKLLKTIRKSIEAGTYPKDDTNLSAEKLIWYYPWSKYRMNTKKPELLFGEPYITHEEDGVTYKYNAYGIAEGFFVTDTASMLVDIVTKMTIKTLKAYGYNYSPKREVPFDQKYAVNSSLYKRKPYILLKDPEDINDYNEKGTAFTPTIEIQKKLDAYPVYEIINPEHIVFSGRRYSYDVAGLKKAADVAFENTWYHSKIFTFFGGLAGLVGTIIHCCTWKGLNNTPTLVIGTSWSMICIGFPFAVAGVVLLIQNYPQYKKQIEIAEEENKKGRK